MPPWPPAARPTSKRSPSACCSGSSIRSTSSRSARRSARRCRAYRSRCRREVLPEFREYERCSTTVCDSYLAPRLGRLPGAARRRGGGARPPEPAGDAVLGRCGRHRHGGRSAPSACLLSGPAGGVVGAAWVAAAQRLPVTCSPSTWAAPPPTSRPCWVARCRRRPSRSWPGCRSSCPMVDVHTVSAGGGSIAWVDAGGALRVGPTLGWSGPRPGCLWPRRRGADGHGREPVSRATCQDGAKLGGEVRLDRGQAERRSVASATSSAWTARRPHAGSSRWPTPR